MRTRASMMAILIVLLLAADPYSYGLSGGDILVSPHPAQIVTAVVLVVLFLSALFPRGPQLSVAGRWRRSLPFALVAVSEVVYFARDGVDRLVWRDGDVFLGTVGVLGVLVIAMALAFSRRFGKWLADGRPGWQ